VAQTAAFSAWLIGHVLLAFVSRSSTDPIHRVGLFSNRVMLLWGGGAMLFLALALAIPAFGDRLGLTGLGSGWFGFVIGIVVLCMGIYELVKVGRARAKRTIRSG
jgi:Ca2+-transporting ATPase